MHARSLSIINARIVIEGTIIEQGELTIENGYIVDLGPAGTVAKDAGSSAESIIDAEGDWLLPGFIDVHIHGGFSHDFMDATREAIDGITHFHAMHGTTGLLATTVTAPQEAIAQVLDAASQYMSSPARCNSLLGVHLEGPFISHKWPGAQNPKFIVPPQQAWLETWAKQYPGLIRMVTLAPETDGAFRLIEWLASNGIIAACGHTDATYEIIEEAVKHGLRHAVHTYNAMTGLHHRLPGTLGAVLTNDAVMAEVIADGIHVHPAAIRLLVKAKGTDRLTLITDAMSAAGLGDGLYDLGGLAVVVKDGAAHLVEGNALAGSTLTMSGAFKFMADHSGLSVPVISQLASGNPAASLGLSSVTGSIAIGKRADLVLATPEFDVRDTWIQGERVQRA
jgi:N-acetylglucosamine-6-phosphate deacetylase